MTGWKETKEPCSYSDAKHKVTWIGLFLSYAFYLPLQLLSPSVRPCVSQAVTSNLDQVASPPHSLSLFPLRTTHVRTYSIRLGVRDSSYPGERDSERDLRFLVPHSTYVQYGGGGGIRFAQ